MTRIDIILTMVPTVAYKTLVLFEKHGGKPSLANLKKAGWSLARVSALDSQGRMIWIADAHRGDGKRFLVRADGELFLELETAISVQHAASSNTAVHQTRPHMKIRRRLT